MDLWIRSQDKMTLKKIIDLSISQNLFTNEYTILCNHNVFGDYATKERALEVLDEIQKKINLVCLGHDFGSPMIDLKNPTYIYEMPKE